MRFALFKHGVKRLHVILGEMTQRLEGRSLDHALSQGGMNAHAQQFLGQAHGLWWPAGNLAGDGRGLIQQCLMVDHMVDQSKLKRGGRCGTINGGDCGDFDIVISIIKPSRRSPFLAHPAATASPGSNQPSVFGTDGSPPQAISNLVTRCTQTAKLLLFVAKGRLRIAHFPKYLGNLALNCRLPERKVICSSIYLFGRDFVLSELFLLNGLFSGQTSVRMRT